MKFSYFFKWIFLFLVAVVVAGALSSACHADSYTSVEPGRLVSQEDYDRNLSRSGEVFCDLYKSAWHRSELSQALRKAVENSLQRHPERPPIGFWHDLPRERKEMRPYINYMVDLFMNDYDPFIASIEEEFDEFFMKMSLDFFNIAFHKAENEVRVRGRGRDALAKLRQSAPGWLKGYGDEISREVLDSVDARVYVDSMLEKAVLPASVGAGVGMGAGLLAACLAMSGPPGWLVGMAASFGGALAGGAVAGTAANTGALLDRAYKTPGEFENAFFRASEHAYRDEYPVEIWEKAIGIVARGVLREIENDVIRRRKEAEEGVDGGQNALEDPEYLEDPDVLRALEKAREQDRHLSSKNARGGY